MHTGWYASPSFTGAASANPAPSECQPAPPCGSLFTL